MQNLHYLETCHFYTHKKDLKEVVSAEDRRVLELAELTDGFDFDQTFSALFAWCQSAFLRVEQLTKKEYSIRILAEDETDAALALAWKVLTEYESPDYAPEGTEEFRKTLKNGAYLANLRYYGAFDGEKLIGLLAIRVRQLNSLPYGLHFFKAIGFTAIDRELTVNGIRFTPMEYNAKEGTQDI